MDDLLLSAIIIAGTLFVVVMIFIISNKTKKHQAELIQSLAQARGWVYTPLRERLSTGYRLQSDRWTLEALTWSSGHSPEPSQSDVNQRTHLWTNKISIPAGLVLIGPWSGSIPDMENFGRMMMNKIIERYLGVINADLQDIPAGSPEFQKKFKVFVQHMEDGPKILSPGVEHELLRWKGPLPVIKITPQEMRIEVQGKHAKAESDIIAITGLAETIISHWK